MSSTSMEDIFKMVAGLQNVQTPAPTAPVASAHQIKTADPDPVLFTPWEPDFMAGYQIKTETGKILSVPHIWDAYVDGEPIILSGPTGSGKSSLAYHLLDIANAKIRKENKVSFLANQKIIKAHIAKGGALDSVDLDQLHAYTLLPYMPAPCLCGPELRTAKLIGDVSIKTDSDTGARFVYTIKGSLLKAWSEGMTWIGEEMDTSPAAVWSESHVFFDGRTKATTVYINGPEEFRKNDRFRVIATMNTLGQGENQQDYAGTQVLNKAFLDRFVYCINLDYLPRDSEITLVHNRTGLRKDIVDKMVLAAQQTRTAASQMPPLVDRAISTRNIMAWSRECLRDEKRIKGSGKEVPANVHDYWQIIAVHAAYPTFLSKIVDDNTRGMFKQYLSIS